MILNWLVIQIFNCIIICYFFLIVDVNTTWIQSLVIDWFNICLWHLMLTVRSNPWRHLEYNICWWFIGHWWTDIPHTHVMIIHIRVLDEYVFMDSNEASSTSMWKQLCFLRLLMERVLTLDHLLWTLVVINNSTTILVNVLPQEILFIWRIIWQLWMFHFA